MFSLCLFCVFICREDPELLIGFEIEMTSWGFLIDRGAHLSINMRQKLSRIYGKKTSYLFARPLVLKINPIFLFYLDPNLKFRGCFKSITAWFSKLFATAVPKIELLDMLEL